MALRSLIVAIGLLAFGATGCRSGDAATSETDDLIVSADARNLALMMSAYNEGEDDRIWSKNSIDQLRWALNGIRGSRKVRVIEKHDLSSDQILAQTTRAARAVGADGTLVWYVATHGWTDGFVAADERRIRPADIVAALRAGRQTPIKRLIMMFDYCGAGGMVGALELKSSGDTASPLANVGQSQAPDDWTRALVDALAEAGPSRGLGLRETGDQPPLYETAIYMSPVTKIQTTSGSTFTDAVASVVEANWTNEDLTIRQFLEQSAERIAQTTTDEYPTADDADRIDAPQRMVFRALPSDAFLDERLFTLD